MSERELSEQKRKELEDKGAQLARHLAAAAQLADELEEYLPIASPGRGYIEWEQLHWMSAAVPLSEEEQDGSN